jgi:hypothetical protein
VRPLVCKYDRWSFFAYLINNNNVTCNHIVGKAPGLRYKTSQKIHTCDPFNESCSRVGNHKIPENRNLAR